MSLSMPGYGYMPVAGWPRVPYPYVSTSRMLSVMSSTPFGAPKTSPSVEQFLKKQKPIELLGVTNILTRITTQLMLANGMRLPFKVYVMNQPNSFSASSMPNGNILFHVGLLKLAQSPEELAFVLAHELSHLRLLHGQNVQRRRRLGALAFLGVLMADFAMIVKRIGLMKLGFVNLGAYVFGRQLSAKYAQKDETQADFHAAHLLTNAGFSPFGYTTLTATTALIEENWPFRIKLRMALLGSSHPVPTNRKATLDQLLYNYWAVRPQPKPLMSPQEWKALKVSCGGALFYVLSPGKSAFGENKSALME